MYLSATKFILFLTVCSADSFRMYGLGTGFRFLKRIISHPGVFDTSSVETKWMEQPLDHFDLNENRTWKMRYFENLEFWKPNGTIYLFIGGEGEAHPGFLTTGMLYELAEETNGAMFGSEHRYYGKSMPLSNSVTENLKFLSSRQALSDLERMLINIKNDSKYANSKVVVIGGSYPGNLAAWMRMLYPNLVDAAVASSAPVLAKKDFYEYLEAVSDDYEQLGPAGCWDNVSQIFRRYEKLFQTEDGIKQLKKEEKICDDNDLSKPENKQLFFMDKISEFMGRAQYGTPKHISQHCEKLAKSSRVTLSKQFFEDEPTFWREETECYDYEFYDMIEEMREIDWVTSWIYQTCTEFGYYQTTTSDKQPFTNNVPPELYYKMCSAMFGDDFNEKRIDESVESTNAFYGGLRPNVTHVVFTNGDMDPWSRLGILEDLSYEAPAKVIPRASHCRDLFSNRKGDSEELKEARAFVKYSIKNWLGLVDYFQS